MLRGKNRALGLFINVPEFADKLKTEIKYGGEVEDSSKRILNQASRAEAVVLDDFGAGNFTPYFLENLYILINRRLNEQLCTFVTLDVNIETLKAEAESKGLGHDFERILNRIREIASGTWS